MSKKVYSGLDNLPSGNTSGVLTEGCLCLEGGAFRGVYTSGVLDAMMEHDINFNCVIGVSAGALNGYNYVSGQIGRSGWINLGHRHESKYVGGKAFLHSMSPLNLDYLLEDIKEDYPFDQERFDDPNRRFIAVATHYVTGKTMYFEKGKCGDIDAAVKASASLPFMSAPVLVDGTPCLDGGCNGCKIPYEWALENQFDKIVIVKTREHGFRREIGSADLVPRFYHKTPKFAEALKESDEIANRQVEEIEALEEAGRVFVIEPSQSIQISRLESDMEKLGELYYLGYNDMLARMDDLKKYLGMDTTSDSSDINSVETDQTENKKSIYFVRHGESEWNVADKICGCTDIPLTEHGHEQAILAGEAVLKQGVKIDRILYSPLQRAKDTALHISEITGIPAMQENRLIEQNFGRFEGTSPRNAPEFVAAKMQFMNSYDGGESMFRLAQRIYNLLDELKEDDLTYMLVAHNGIARVVKSYFEDMTNEEYAGFGVPNSTITEFTFKNEDK